MIVVCSLARLNETVAAHGARRVISLLGDPDLMIHPPGVAAADHLYLEVHDIAEASEGHILAAADHIDTALAFVRAWDRAAPMVVHCWAGVSRSSAMAYLAACALQPQRDEHDIAQGLRAASPTAYPNRRIVALGDAVLGRGEVAPEAQPFVLALDGAPAGRGASAR